MSEWEMDRPATAESPEPETQAAEETAAEQLGLIDSPEAAETEEARLKALLEAMVYITDEPLSAPQLAQAIGRPKDRIQRLLEELVAEYNLEHHGLTVREVAGGYKMSTKAEYHDEIRSFVKKLKPPLKLSLPALETLAVIAYKQPVTAPEIMEIRGVQGAGVLKTLMERKLITAAGRKQVVGKPVLYKTTRDFLIQFGLKDLSELPTLKEFEEWSRLALSEGEIQSVAPLSGEGTRPATDGAAREEETEEDLTPKPDPEG